MYFYFQLYFSSFKSGSLKEARTFPQASHIRPGTCPVRTPPHTYWTRLRSVQYFFFYFFEFRTRLDTCRTGSCWTRWGKNRNFFYKRAVFAKRESGLGFMFRLRLPKRSVSRERTQFD